MPDNQIRLREALDQIANALQPAVVIVGQLQQSSEATARDAAVIQAALTRTVAILKEVQRDRPEWLRLGRKLIRRAISSAVKASQRDQESSMFGLSSLRETVAWLREEWGYWPAKLIAGLITLALVGVCLAGIGLGVSAVAPAALGIWSLLPGTAVAFNWTQAVPSIVTLVIFCGVVFLMYWRFSDVAKTVRIMSDWLSEPLETRLKQLEESDAALYANVQAHESVVKELADLRSRVHKLEIHTGTDRLFQELVSVRLFSSGREGAS